MTLGDGEGRGERAPSRRYGASPSRLALPSMPHRTGHSGAVIVPVLAISPEGTAVSDREYPWALLASGMQRALPLRPVLAAPLGVCSSSLAGRCRGPLWSAIVGGRCCSSLLYGPGGDLAPLGCE